MPLSIQRNQPFALAHLPSSSHDHVRRLRWLSRRGAGVRLRLHASARYAAPEPGRVGDYQPVPKACVAVDGRKAVAIREMNVAGQEDRAPRRSRGANHAARTPSVLDLPRRERGRTRCDPHGPRHPRIRRGAWPHPPRLSPERRAHATAGAKAISSPATSAQAGSRSIARSSPGSKRRRARTLPVALSISGLWLIHHFDDFRWLVSQRNSGALTILWTDHTYHHPYRRKLPDDANFLLSRRA